MCPSQKCANIKLSICFPTSLTSLLLPYCSVSLLHRLIYQTVHDSKFMNGHLFRLRVRQHTNTKTIVKSWYEVDMMSHRPIPGLLLLGDTHVSPSRKSKWGQVVQVEWRITNTTFTWLVISYTINWLTDIIKINSFFEHLYITSTGYWIILKSKNGYPQKYFHIQLICIINKHITTACFHSIHVQNNIDHIFGSLK